MKKIVFATGNKGKISSARQHFDEAGIEMEVFSRALDEPRSDDIKAIAHAKAMQAYSYVNKPCIALDSGFFIDSLNGFPRAFVNFALETIGLEGFIKLMEGKENRSCYFRECLAYYDGREMTYFQCDVPGKIAAGIRGSDKREQWSPLWKIFIPGDSGNGRALSEYTPDEITAFRQDGGDSSIQQFACWYAK